MAQRKDPGTVAQSCDASKDVEASVLNDWRRRCQTDRQVTGNTLSLTWIDNKTLDILLRVSKEPIQNELFYG